MGLNTHQTGFFVHTGAVEDVPCTVTYTSGNWQSYTISNHIHLPADWGWDYPSRAEVMRRTARVIFGDIL